MRHEKLIIDSGSFVVTPEGYIKVPARLARTGIQQYLESEVKDGGNPNKIVNVLRPADEVFDTQSLDSFSNLLLTNGHPPVAVDSKTWKKYAVGFTGPVRQEGDYVLADIVITDEKAVRDWKNGKREISNGYSCLDVPEKGEFNGVKYDYVQRSIRGNHVALVDKGRCGGTCRTLDTDINKTDEVKTMKIMVDGVPIEIADDTAATVVKTAIDRMQDEVKVLQDALAQAKADGCSQKEYDELKKEYDAMGEKLKDMEKELEEKKKDSMPEHIDALVNARMNNVEIAKRVYDGEYDHKGKSCDDIKNDCVVKVYPAIKLDEISEGVRDGLFMAIATDVTQEKPSNAMADLWSKQDSGIPEKNDNGLNEYVSSTLNGLKGGSK